MKVGIKFEMPSESLAINARDALNLNKKMSRGRIEITTDGSILSFDIQAKDLTALRAALNTHLRLLDSLIKTWEVVENGRSERC